MTNASDIRHDGLVGALPRRWQPYARLARLDRPIGTWLLLFPCWWSLALAGDHQPWLYLLFGIGAVVMRGAGCTVNDIVDRKIDAQVARTATRPLPSGEVTLQQALLFLVAQLLIGLLVLLQLPLFAIQMGAASLGLVISYPFMKRITWWPQFVLGLAFNWGALLGWAAVHQSLAGPPVLLYAAGILWTLGYDTIYAHQDKQDDEKIGVKSTARRFGDHSARWIGGFYAGMVVLMVPALLLAGFAPWLTALVVLALAGQLLWQMRAVRYDDPANCLRVFRANVWAGWLVLAGLLLGNFV